MRFVDKLVKIKRKEWPKLRDLYSTHLSDSHIGYYTLDNYIRWLTQDSKVKNIAIYCLNGDFSDGTFVAVDRYHAFIDTLNETNDNLIRLLRLLDYSKGFRFMCVRSGVRMAILNVIKARSLTLEFDDHDTALLYHMPVDKILKLDMTIPSDIKLRRLTAADVEKANQLWPHQHNGSAGFLERLAKFNTNVGAFTDDGELIAWVFRFQAGPLCALQTVKSHYGKGLGTLVSKIVLKEIALMGHDGFAGILEDNYASRALFERLGFKVIDRIHWYATIHEWKDD